MDNVTKVNLGSSNNEEPEVYKVDLTKPPVSETEETTTDPAGVVGGDENTGPAEEQEEVQPQAEVQEAEAPVLEEVVDQVVEEKVEAVTETVEEVIAEAKETGKALPEGIQKLVDFMADTGGDINDYVRLNTDISKLDPTDALDEYYKQSKPHLSPEERSFLLEEKFGFDEDVDSDRDIKRKKIALKEEVANARKHLEKQKDKYYNEIKAGSNLSTEQQEAIDFFNRYNKDSAVQKETTEATTKAFRQRTDTVFGEEFKGFDFNVGDKKFRYNVKNKTEVKETQSDLSNFVNKFVGEDNTIQDAAGYHKSLFAAMNADALAQHFYEQGKADAIKGAVAQGKNVNTEARQTHGEAQVGGVKFKVLGDSSKDFKFKIRNKR
ncbi:hypothetical protein N9121_00835 [Pseudomonadales bacterium]|nr:hypothetical protein [Pseudomonadales bacterium]